LTHKYQTKNPTAMATIAHSNRISTIRFFVNIEPSRRLQGNDGRAFTESSQYCMLHSGGANATPVDSAGWSMLKPMIRDFGRLAEGRIAWLTSRERFAVREMHWAAAKGEWWSRGYISWWRERVREYRSRKRIWELVSKIMRSLRLGPGSLG
jgi:hypothetical protein